MKLLEKRLPLIVAAIFATWMLCKMPGPVSGFMGFVVVFGGIATVLKK